MADNLFSYKLEKSLFVEFEIKGFLASVAGEIVEIGFGAILFQNLWEFY